MKFFKKISQKITRFKSHSSQTLRHFRDETDLLAIGTMLSQQQNLLNFDKLSDYEFKIFSQWGDDGIIQYLIKHVPVKNNVFIEFGVEDFAESNSRFLMMNNNWSGFVMDGSSNAMDRLRNRSWFWKYDISYKTVFIDKDNINSLLAGTGFSDIGILSVDLDGNDYFIFDEIDLTKLNPSIIIMEYNAVFGKDRFISVPYRKDFMRGRAHYSYLFFGASLAALNYAATKKGYSLVGCTSAGNNAYFVRNDLLNSKIRAVDVHTAFVDSRFREGRNEDYSLSFVPGDKRLDTIKGLDVVNVKTNKIEKL